MKNNNIYILPSSNISNSNHKIYDLKFFNENTLIYSDINGTIQYYSLINNNQTNIINLTESSLFTLDIISNKIITGTSKGEIFLLENNKIISNKFNSNLNKKEESITKVKFINENLFCSGNSKGEICIFDIRAKNKNNSIFTFNEQEEDITDFCLSEDNNTMPHYLLSTSIDGTIGVYDLRKKKLNALSDNMEESLNCILPINYTNNILVGTDSGNVMIFNWGWWGDFKDRITGFKEEINDIDKISEDVFLTCGKNIKICSFKDKKVKGIIEEKEKIKENEMFENEKIKLSPENGKVAVVCNISFIKVFDIKDLDLEKKYTGIKNESEENDINESDNNDEDSNGEQEEDEEEEEDFEENINKNNNDNNDEDEEEDEKEEEEKEEDEKEEDELNDKNNSMDESEEEENENEKEKEEDEDEESSFSSSSSSENNKKKKKNKFLGQKRNTKSLIEKERRIDFFSDL